MGLISWIAVGILAGLAGGLVLKGDAKVGMLGNVAAGVAGAFIGGFVMSLVGQTGIWDFNLWNLVASLLGAVILLAVVKVLFGRRTM